jgi:branched-chain amino acid transport system ATP-binding protein
VSPEAVGAEAVLRTEGLSVRYGGVHALEDVNLEVREGQLVGLIGANGAGKTTFIDAIGGFTTARGRVILRGTEISGLVAHRRAGRGLARTWQSTELFEDLTVRENLTVACGLPGLSRLLRAILTGRAIEDAGVDDALALLGIASLGPELPANLTLGQRKLVGVGRALAARPALLCLDEPAAGLDAEESRTFGARLREVVSNGTTTLLIDHDMNLVLGICDYVYVLDFGVVIAHGTPQAVRVDPRVIAAHLGQPAAGSRVRHDHGTDAREAP